MAGFVVIYYGNTGSSWLVETLGTSPQVLVPGFEPVEGWAWDGPASERLAWIHTALSPPPEREGPIYEEWVEKLKASPQVSGDLHKPSFEQVGFKMNALAVFETQSVIDVIDDTGAKAVVLSRRNRIKHALSLYRYHEENKSQFGGKGPRPPTELDLELFEKWLDESKRLHGHSERIQDALFRRLGKERVTTVAYEDFVTAPGKDATIGRLSEFLGLEPWEPDRSSYDKATPDDLKSAVVNYSDLKRKYRFTPYRRYFRD